MTELGLDMIPAVLDRIDDKVGAAYSGHPDRLYLVGKDGKIAYAGARGPFGFSPGELEMAIIEELSVIDAAERERRKKRTEKPSEKPAPKRGKKG